MKGMRLSTVLAAALAVVALGAGTAAATGAFSANPSKPEVQAIRSALHDRDPKNVIFLLGDGMGTQEITAARYYQGVHNPLNVDRMPFTGFDTTWSVKPGASAPYLPDYDPDSASTGTAWATGAEDDRRADLPGPEQRRERPRREPDRPSSSSPRSAGMKVGDVSTAEITDATPAVLASHISLRGCQGPANMAACPTETKGAGGLGSIAEQEVDHKVDVLLGGGRDRFDGDHRQRPRRRQDGGRIGPGARATSTSPTPPAWPRSTQRQTGARPVQHRQHVAGVDRPGRLDRQGQRAGRRAPRASARRTSRAWRR